MMSEEQITQFISLLQQTRPMGKAITGFARTESKLLVYLRDGQVLTFYI